MGRGCRAGLNGEAPRTAVVPPTARSGCVEQAWSLGTNHATASRRSWLVRHFAYGPLVKRLLERTPHWVTILLGGIGVVGLLAYPVVTVGWKGWARWVALGVAALCAVISFGAPHWQQWKSQQESRLRLDVAIEPVLAPSFATLDDFIDGWVQDERNVCLASLAAPITMAGGVSEPEPGDAQLLSGVGIKDLLLLEERQGAGDALTDQDEAVLAASRRMMSRLATAVTGRWSPFTEPDPRSPVQYVGEVEGYLARCSRQMRQTVEWGYARQADLGLTVTVVNPTDRVYESVQVEIYLSGAVSAIAMADLIKPTDQLPPRPRSFGEPHHLDITIPGRIFSPAPRALTLPGGPRINNSRSVEITHQPVTLRPRSRVVLDIVHLLPTVAPGSTLDGTWSATATNAQGKISGPFTMTVGQDFPISEVLGTVLAGPGGTE